ncbi:MAG: endo-1,4-beta-xylanase [Anaerolineales bacterium]|nr:endo-1,4-beta-xylanase [Anaerolineales bacterium]
MNACRLFSVCVLVCLASCAAGEKIGISSAGTVPSPKPGQTSSPTPFQPAAPSVTRSPGATAVPSQTPTPSRTAYQTPAGGETLRSVADALGFGIGTPYQNLEARGPSFQSLFTAEFNTVMMTTFMKKTQPERDRFDWSLADSVLQLAQASGMTIVGGPLVYDNLTAPAWLGFDTEDCGSWSADELEEILKGFIQTAVSRYGKKVSTWEVVNEPLTSGDNCWRTILGDQYIDRAYRYAHESNPEAALMLNEAFGREGVDRNLTDRFMGLVRRLKESGIPVNTVGIQMHLSAELLRPGYPEEFRYFLEQAQRHGVGVMITEMDVFQGPPGFFTNPDDVQKKIFQTIAQVCLETSRCTHLILWGVSDRYTWLSRIEGGGFENPRPLLFDDNFLRKPAYFGVLDALREALMDRER